MTTKLYEYGTDKLPMKVLKNLHEVIDFVNTRNENLKQSTVCQRIISQINRGINRVKPDPNMWKPIWNGWKDFKSSERWD